MGVPALGRGCLVETLRTATAAGGTHPTGMHSCFKQESTIYLQEMYQQDGNLPVYSEVSSILKLSMRSFIWRYEFEVQKCSKFEGRRGGSRGAIEQSWVWSQKKFKFFMRRSNSGGGRGVIGGWWCSKFESSLIPDFHTLLQYMMSKFHEEMQILALCRDVTKFRPSGWQL